MSLDIVVLDVCKKELSKFPKEVLEDLLDALAKLSKGLNLSMPLSRPIPSIERGLHELRLKDKSGIYRAFYLIKKKDGIYVVHAFKKTTQETPEKNKRIVKKRIGRIS